ncbi:MAG: D-amino acid dehydrogenase [Rhizobiaceae bacterium]|nr:D-amino acid dehydrogenase [Rhizobiaceae bacterium]
MKVVVFGAGVIGVTTAYYLARAGHCVEVVERRESVACETSYANAGQVSPGYSAPWAGPGIPLKALKWLSMQHGPLVLRAVADPAMWSWLSRMLRNCTGQRYEVNKGRMLSLAEYSRDCLRELRTETGITYDERSLGTLQLFRTAKQLDGVARDIEILREFGVEHRLLDQDGCISAEPGLARSSAQFVGGLRLPGDETGDCRVFTQKLTAAAEALGARFSFGEALVEMVGDGRVAKGAVTSRGLRIADAYVVATGSYTPPLVERFGVVLPVYPVKGYSLTMPVREPEHAPVSTIMDETYKTAITRLGDRVRVGGTAELAGFDPKLRPGRKRALLHSFTALFPTAANVGEAEFWCGFRPMTPDGTPVVGPTPLRNLFLNTGHGTLGWTMACGSARILTDLVSGRPADIDPRALSVSRYV